MRRKGKSNSNPVTARVMVLQALRGGANFGSNIINNIVRFTGGSVTIGSGTISPAILTLKRDGLIETCDGPQRDVGGGRPRIYHRLTAKGRERADADRSLFLLLGASTDAAWSTPK